MKSKQIVAMAAVLAAGLGLSACNGDDDNGGGSSSSGGSSNSSSSSSGGSSSSSSSSSSGSSSSGGSAACTAPITTGATVKTATTATCLSCAVNNPANVLSGNPAKFADVDLNLSALTGAAAIQVTAPTGVTYPAGQIAGYTMSVPPAVLTASVLPQITISTALAGTTQDTVTYTQVLSLDLLNLLSNNTPFFLGVQSTKAFDSVEVTIAPVLLTAAGVVDVYGACSAGTGLGVLAPLPGPALPLPIP